MSRPQNILSAASVKAALERLKTLTQLSASDHAQLHQLADRLDRESHRAHVEAALPPLFPEVREDGRENALSKLVLRLKSAQDTAISEGTLSESFRLTLKVERKNVGAQRLLWFMGKAQTQAQPRLHDLDAAQPLYENTTRAPELLGRAAKGAEPILLLTVTERETAALYRQFSPKAVPLIFDRDGEPYALLGWLPGDGQNENGRPHRRPLIAYQCKMGAMRSGAAILRTQRAIQHHAPFVVIAVGIAFGDKRQQALGDVLVAEQVATYESARHNPDGSRTQRGERLPAPSRWLTRTGLHSHGGFAVRKGLMLCGEALLDNADERARLNAEFPTAIGGDMESFGMAVTCHEAKVDWLVIKGVSDWGDGSKALGSDADKHAVQLRAAQNAARVAYSTVYLTPAPEVIPAVPVHLQIPIELFAIDTPCPERHAPADTAIDDTPVQSRSRAEQVRCALPRYKEENILRGPLYDVYGETFSQRNHAMGAGGPAQPRVRASEEDAARIAEASQTIHQSLLDWLRNDSAPPLFALLGEYGMGKTVSCQRLSRSLAEARAAGSAPPWMRMPVYFDLRNLTLFKGMNSGRAVQMPTIRAIVDDLFERGWSVPSGAAMPGYDDLREWLHEGALLILDGLDECLVHLEDSQHSDFLRMLQNLVSDAKKAAEAKGSLAPRLLISCRTNFFKTVSGQRDYFTGHRRGNVDAEDYESRVLLPLTNAQIAGYIASAVPNLPLAAVEALIDGTHDLRELAERPMTLTLLADYIPDLERVRQAGGTVNGAYLYGLIACEWLQRDEGKHHLAPEHKLRLMPALAAHLWRSGVRTLPYSELHQWFHDWRRSQPDLEELYAPAVYLRVKLEEDLRTATFVVRQDPEGAPGDDDSDSAPAEGFRFAHTSMQEYFLAVYLADAVREDRPDDWEMTIPSEETLNFLAQRLELDQAALPAPRRRAGGLPLVLSRWAKTYRAKASELLLKYSLHARSAKVQTPVLPDLRGFDLRNSKLRGWRFGERFADKAAPLLDMAAVQWAGADLRNTRFNHVRLDDGDFSAARADCAAFQHCSLQRTQWPQAELPGTVFRHCRLQGSGGLYDGQSRSPALRHRTQFVTCSGDEPMGDVVNRPGESLWLPDGPTAQLASTAPVQQSGWWTSLPQRDHASGPAQDQSGRITYTTPGFPAHVTHPAVGLALLAAGRAGVAGAALSADGGRVVSCSDDGSIRVWDALSGECVRELVGHTNGVRSIALSANGGRVVSGSDDGSVRVWDALSGECVHALGHTNGVLSVALSADGNRVLSCSYDSSLRVWDGVSGGCIRELVGHRNAVLSTALSADGSRAVSCSDDGSVRVWDVLSGECVHMLTGHMSGVLSVALSADGGRVVSCSDDGNVRVWNAWSGECERELVRHTNGVSSLALSVALSADGDRVVSCSDDGRVWVWDALSGECVRELVTHANGVLSIALSADGGLVMSSSYDSSVWVWDASSGECLRTLVGHTDGMRSVALSADGRLMVSGSYDGRVRVWDGLSGECLHELVAHTNGVFSIALSADGGRVVGGAYDGSVLVWDAWSGECVRMLVGHADAVWSVALSADGSRIVSCSDDGSVRVWDASSGACVRELVGHKKGVRSVAVSADGGRVVSCSYDGSIRVWNGLSGECVRELVGNVMLSVALSADGDRMVSISYDGSVRVWDASSGDCILELVGQGNGWWNVAVSADGGRVVSCSDDSSVRVWNASSGECVRELVGHTNGVRSVALSADGTLASACDDGAVRVFRGPNGQGVLQDGGPERLEADLAMFAHDIDGVLSQARWRPAHAQWEGDPLPPDGGELLHASGDAWKVLAWQVFDHPSAPGQWTRIPLQGYE